MIRLASLAIAVELLLCLASLAGVVRFWGTPGPMVFVFAGAAVFAAVCAADLIAHVASPHRQGRLR